MKLPQDYLLMTLCYLIDQAKQQIILGQKRYGKSRGVIIGFGGKVEPTDENIKAAVVREVWEEAGITIKNPKLKCILHFNNKNEANQEGLAYVFLAHHWIGKPKTTSEMKPITFSLDKIPLNRMYADDRYWFNLIFSDQQALVYFNRDKNLKSKDIFIKFATKLPIKFSRQLVSKTYQ